MNQTLIKPFATVEGGGGNVYVPPPPSPTLSIDITSPANNAAVVGDNPGVGLTVVCNVTVGGLIPREQWADNLSVSIQLERGKAHTAFLTAGDWTANDTTTWSWTGQTLAGGPLTIGASVYLAYGYVGGFATMTKTADPITVEPSAVDLVVAAPSDGQVFIGTSTGYVISASGSASSAVAIFSVGWQLFSGITTSGTALSSGNMTPGSNGWSSWNGSISVPLGLYTLQITATDASDSTRIINVAVQVTLQADIFDTTAGSYLRGLVEFATKPFDNQGKSRVLTNGSASAGITDLDSTFYQSTALLLDDTYSAKANEAVYQTRICVEVLRKYVAAHSPTTAQTQALTTAELAYRQAAYLSLLQQVGTSYDEIRLARTYNRQDPNGLAQAQALAARLGIDLGSPDHLTSLLFDPTILPSQSDPPPPAPPKLTEGDLEQIFGLLDTTRDPFSQGPATATSLPNALPQPIRWNLNGVQWPRNTDPDGFIYGSVTGAPLPAPIVKLYADPARTREVGTGSAVGGTAVIVPSNNSGLSGKIAMTGTTADQFVLSAMPRLLGWQRQHLRGVWQQQDFQFTQGAVAGDSQSQIVSCNLTGVQPGQNTDANGVIYISLQQTAGPNYQVTLYSDAARTKSVASGAGPTPTAQISLTAANNSGLSGSVAINYKADSTQISVPIVFSNPPLIDPDVLIPGDFAFPIAGDPAYSLFAGSAGRQTTVQGWISELQTLAGGTLAGLNTILQNVLKDPQYYPNGMQVGDIANLGAQLQSGNDISAQLTALQLPLDAFTYLFQLCPLVQNGLPVLASEWGDIYSILAQVQKVRAYTAWSIAELNAGLTRGPDYFNYPPSVPALADTGIDTSGLPLSGGTADPRWTIVSTPSGSTSAPAYVTNSNYPIGSAWVVDDANSQWISPQADESRGDPPGLYTYRTSFDLTGYDPGSVSLALQVAVDDQVNAIRLHGVGLGLSASGYSGFTDLSINGPFQAGANTLDFVVYNAGTAANPSGLRVGFSFANSPNPVDPPAWRATAEQRQAWQDSLEARINQDSSLATGLQAAVDQTEQQTLAQFRDSLVAAGAVEASIPSLASTGLDQAAFAGLFQDADWSITATPSGPPSPYAYVPISLANGWMPNSGSCWISPNIMEGAGSGDAAGSYTYETTFDNPFDPTLFQARLLMNVAVDSSVSDVELNGQSLGLSATGFTKFTPLAISGVVKGKNKLDVIVNNTAPAPHPSGLRVELLLSAAPPPPAPGVAALALPPPPAMPSTGRNLATVGNICSDQNWSITAIPEGTQPNGTAFVPQPPDSAWAPDDDASSWISPSPLEAPGPGDAPGNYVYHTTFDLSLFDPSTVAINMNVWVDNSITDVKLNGQSLGLTASGYAAPTPLALTKGFVQGINTLDVLVNNAGTSPNPSGLRVEFSSTAPVPVSADWLTQALLIDVEDTSQQKTTRLGEAIEMMQSLFFALRNAQFERLSPSAAASSWALNRYEPLPSFDEEWNWMGSYGNWQSALRVFLYPENLLLPSLRLTAAAANGEPGWIGEETAAFDSFVNALDLNAPLMPGEALTAANSYLAALNSNNVLTLSAVADHSGGSTVYTGTITGGDNSAFAGMTFQVAGFTTPANIGSFPCTASTATTLTLSNPNGGAETDAGTATDGPLYPDLPDELKPPFQYSDPSTIDPSSPAAMSAALASYVKASNETAVAFLWEAWYCVPVQIALELQKAGQFEAALDWFGLVYAYDLPLSNGKHFYRRVFPGLVTESTQATYAQIPTSLIDSSNPHQVAPTRACPYTRFALLSIVQCLLDFADAQFGTETADSIANARSLYLQALGLLNDVHEVLPADPVTEANPHLTAMQQHAETNLFFLRTGRNIAVMLLPAQATSDQAMSIQPSAYRYTALRDQAKQLVTIAQQVEATYLASLAAADNETYTALKANQDLQTANATVTLQQLQLQTAKAGVTLANDQVSKANDAYNHYFSLIYDSDIVSLEQTSIDFQWGAVGLQTAATAVSAASTFNILGATLSAGESVSAGIAAALSSAAGAASTTASVLNAQASLEEKQSDWQFGLNQAQDDVTIGKQQATIAADQQATATQQLNIAYLQAGNAQAAVNFLANKFTNADLYRWMSGVLGGVYAYFLQQAAAMARLAENQLAFERQQKPLSIIRPDYWQPLSSAMNGNSGVQNSQGLTGAETLLEDITTVDQYAFATDQIKLQITKTISLALLDPFAFQQFTETGVLRFATPMELFDRGFPGHYFRQISEVRASVVALVPPSLGINATLANSGISRVIVQNDPSDFQSVVVQRDPQLIALSSPNNSTGLFPLTTSSQSALLLPFEDLGVDTSWEFTMAKAANPFDYSTIADVQISIDYTALDSPDYRLQVIQQLDQSVSADRAYSFVQQFPDAWYELNNASQYPTPFTVQFQSQAPDFPPNVENVTIAQLLMYFIPADGASFQLQPKLSFTPSGASTPIPPAAAAAPGAGAPPVYVFSTRRDNASAWLPILGQSVTGTWTLTLQLPNNATPAGIFQNQQIQDILFVVTYSGNTPAWPS